MEGPFLTLNVANLGTHVNCLEKSYLANYLFLLLVNIYYKDMKYRLCA